MLHDIRFAFRRLLSRPGFTTLTVLTLALGIGASTAVFSVVDQTVLRPPPFAHADRLVDVINITNRKTGSGGNSLTAAKTLAWQSQPSVFERLEVYAPRAFDVTGGAEPERVSGLLVSTNNAAERALRGPVVGRKNHYGSRSLRGTQVAALFYTLCETAKLAGLDPHTYLLRALYAAIAQAGAVTYAEDLLNATPS
jgi:hypothetical protein